MRTFLATTWTFVKVWFARIALIIMAVCLILAYYGVPIDPKYYPAVFAILLFGIYEVVFDIKTAGERIDFADIVRRVDEFQGSILTLINHLSPKLYALFQCKEELEVTLNKIEAGEKLVIDHLGLDMAEAWDYVQGLFFTPQCRLTDVEYRLLILTDVARPDWPLEVQDWSRQVATALRRIAVDLKKASDPAKPLVRRLRFEVRKYDHLPVVHGWSVRQPVRLQLSHFAFCRWNNSCYKWGGANYIKVDHSLKTSVLGDLSEIFDSYFEYLWTASPELPDLKIDNTKLPAQP